MEKRRINWDEVGEVVEKIKENGLSYKQGAKEYNIPLWQLYDYNRHNNGGSNPNVAEDSKSDKREKVKEVELPCDVQELITGYRKENPEHGYKKIQDWLKKKYLVVIQRKKIREVLKKHNLLVSNDSSFDKNPEPSKGSRRFEAKYPGELFQMDITNIYILGLPVLYLISIIDDFSRFIVSSILCMDQSALTLIEVLHNGILQFKKPKKLLTDQGKGFYSWSLEQTRFQEYLDGMGIEHIVSEPHSPQTLGKIEKFNQSIKNELIKKVRFKDYEDAREQIRQYINHYNYERPHQGISGLCPADRYHEVHAEIPRIETELSSRQVDLGNGYLVFKVKEHIISVASSRSGLQIFLDGNLLA